MRWNSPVRQVLAGVVIMLLFGIKKLGWHLAGVIAGTLFFRMILAAALSWGVDPVYLKLVVAALVLGCIALPAVKNRIL